MQWRPTTVGTALVLMTEVEEGWCCGMLEGGVDVVTGSNGAVVVGQASAAIVTM